MGEAVVVMKDFLYRSMVTLFDGQSIIVHDCVLFKHPMGDLVKGVVVKIFPEGM